MGKKRAAFTLFEMSVVCAVIALLAVIAVPNLDGYHCEARIIGGADMIKGRLAEARSRAVEESRPYRFEIIDATRCRVVSDLGAGGAPGAASAGPNEDNGEGTPGEDTLPRGVSFDLPGSKTSSDNQGDNNSGAGLKIVFLPDGSARDDAEIRLTSPGSRPVTLQLRALTATITTTRSTEEKGP